jgi:hypothetical protein
MLMGLCGEFCSSIICFSLAVFESDVGGVVVASVTMYWTMMGDNTRLVLP